jgi:hypothetical protein
MLQLQPLEIADFSGGENQYKEADNFVITDNKKLLTRYGSNFFDLDNPQLPDGERRVGNLISFKGYVLAQSRRNLYYFDGLAWVAITGPTGNQAFDIADEIDSVIYSEWNDQLVFTNKVFTRSVRVYLDENDDFQVRTQGLPTLSAPTVTPVAGTKNYIYAFIRHYTYTVGTVQFEEVSDPVLVEVLLSAEPSVSASSITAIPVLSNGATDNYATATLKVQIYRTEDAGTTFYKVGEVTNGTTIFSDTASDASLLTSEVLYTDGDVLGHEQAPLAKYIHIVGDIGVYGYIKQGSQELQDRVMLSVPGQPSAVPSEFFFDLGQKITGISSVDAVPIIFCNKSIFRIDGQFDATGGGNPSTQRISSTVGCVSAHSIIAVTGGCFFAGQDGFYFTDGFRVQKVSSSITARYKQLVQNEAQGARIFGAYDKTDERIWWAVSTNAGDAEHNDKCYILHLNFGLNDSMPFTTASNGANFRPTSLCFHENNLIRGDSRGYVFQHDSTSLSDRKVEVLVDEADWDQETIIYNYEGPATSFGTNMVRKWVPRVSVTAKNETNINLQIVSINDDLRSTANLSIIRFAGSILWGDPDILWGDPNLVWNAQGMLSAIRHFPKNNLRCSLKQIQITNALGLSTNSDYIGTVTVAAVNGAATGTITLDGAFTWPSLSRGYFAYIEDDNYETAFEVLERTSDTVLTVNNFDNKLQSGSQKFILRGKIKNEALNLIGYTLHYAPIGRTQAPYEKADGGANQE